ncbi:putative nucleotidyltransferase with HDIG domain [Natranaerovirga pectinivora]|uniref:Putative nucleotidyltransferase with HDIG domain n=1 Tax=Natranaerovirga pectinivora TaxID=682400 RepID=A0A4R3MP37_9FIRM|nr:HDIG domain-containing metalloprotein [Natranaerovirga pectinivora]TCT17057.1 putative nucleotidyltransferase with HDIG domain [Natranaerovirga pectinivora]
MIKRQRIKNLGLLQCALAFITICSTVGAVLTYVFTEGYYPDTLIGITGTIILLLMGLCFYIFTQKKEIVDHKNTLFLLFFIYHVILVAFILTSKLSFYLLPIAIAGMLIALLLDTQLAIIVNGILAILASLLSLEFNWHILIFYLVSGTMASLLIHHTKLRRNIVWIAITLMATNGFLVVFIKLIVGETPIGIDILYALLNAAFSIILTVGSLPLWEALFEVVTPLKLLELSNSDQKLIKRLLIEAPGTFHHCQLVANLAETASTDIGGDYLLARAGALYHDIGKLKNPHMFKENQSGENPHDTLEPDESARVIIDHVAYGIKLANDYKLPKSIISIIEQHQGTTLVKYFYHKAKENNATEIVEEKEYTYKGPTPQSNEAAIVMLADSVEAAVRCIPQKEKSLQNIEITIKKIIKMKLEEGQLENSDLKIKELNSISDAFLKVYKGMYHERIDYPKEA